ncbi:MAG: hypothetical protein Q9222_006640 [Ikaeria aurantiellina]
MVNTFSAAQSVYGWMGGTDGVRYLLQRVMNPFGQRLKSLKLDRRLRLMPSQAYVLTSQGPLVAHLDDASESFGGDIRTQVIGTTVCALAHECEVLEGVRLFCRFLLPYLFGEASPLLDVLQSQPLENATSQRIINEGASRGLNNMFVDTAAKLNLPTLNSGWGPGGRDESDDKHGPIPMISGLLRWISQDTGHAYRTRSSAIARVAAYLKVVGYNVGDILTWDGDGEPPGPLGIKSVILVLGGSSETDPLMEDEELISDLPLLLHYQHKTTGAMLLTALGHVSDIPPETLQEDFEQVFEYIERHLTVQYICKNEGINAVHQWRGIDKNPNSMTVRLASIYFSHKAEFIAPCYERISKQKYLNCVRGKSKKVMQADETRLARFRAITACVAISIISLFAPETFKEVYHATKLCLNMPGWLSRVCSVLDLDDAFSLPTVVMLLAQVHIGISAGGEYPAASTEAIAWRKGIYSVIPSMLLDMKLSSKEFQFVCLDRFWANVKTEEDGLIKSSNTFEVQRHDIDRNQPLPPGALSTLERMTEPYVGAPDMSAPDCPLYLSLGTPFHYGDPHLGFIGWFQGSVAGTVGVMDVLKAVLLSRVEPDICPGHPGGPKQVVNVKTSAWARERHSKPIDKQHPIFVPVGGDHCWAIFVAGQTVKQGGRIVFRCPECADEKYESSDSGYEREPRYFVGLCEGEPRLTSLEVSA